MSPMPVACVSHRRITPLAPLLSITVAFDAGVVQDRYSSVVPWGSPHSLWNCISNILFRALTGHGSIAQSYHSSPVATWDSSKWSQKPPWHLPLFFFFFLLLYWAASIISVLPLWHRDPGWSRWGAEEGGVEAESAELPRVSQVDLRFLIWPLQWTDQSHPVWILPPYLRGTVCMWVRQHWYFYTYRNIV